VIDSVRTWSACFKSVLVGVSGGLDSSILCAAIDRSETHVRGLNMAWPDAEGDERASARLLTRTLGLELDIFLYRPEHIDIAQPIVTSAVRPFMAPYVQAIVRARDALAPRAAVEAYFSGDGGDNVFCLMQSATPVLDRILGRSRPQDIWNTLNDVARLTGADIPSILRAAVSGLKRARLRGGQAGDSSYLAGAALARAIETVDRHPWLQASHAVLPGAAAHIRMLRRALGNDGFHSRYTHPPAISPLLSQPIVEFCLGIASWDWVRGGMDRALARASFADDLPSEIVHRRTKGGPSGFLNHLYWENEEQILTHLRSGFLASAGIIAGIPVDGNARSADPRAPRRLLGLAAAESWARLWEG
uniref:asparagine synthase-related protein n=1 Tax=Sphingobium sp. Sx8-8 TaxID=2933617 RepID=UPI001F565EC1